MPYRKVLMVRLSALGDVAMTIPVIYSLCRAYPDTTFVMLTQRVVSRLFIQAPANLQIVVADVKGSHRGVAGLYRLAREMRRLSIDAVADLHDVLRSKFLRFFLKMWGIPTVVIDKGRTEKRRLTARKGKALRQLTSSFERYAMVFRELGFDFSLDFVSLYGEARGDAALFAEKSDAKQPGERWVGIAPFAKHVGKIYPLERMEQVVARLSSEEHCKIFLFGAGDAEQAILSRWSEHYPRVVPLADKRYGFDFELALISHLDAMVSMDSANMHLASLVATPVVSVWGATHPYGGFLGWKQSEARVVQRDLSCRPCSVFGNKPCPHHDYTCLDIAPEQIVEQVKRCFTLDIKNNETGIKSRL